MSSFIELSGAQLSCGCLCRPASAKKTSFCLLYLAPLLPPLRSPLPPQRVFFAPSASLSLSPLSPCVHPPAETRAPAAHSSSSSSAAAALLLCGATKLAACFFCPARPSKLHSSSLFLRLRLFGAPPPRAHAQRRKPSSCLIHALECIHMPPPAAATAKASGARQQRRCPRRFRRPPGNIAVTQLQPFSLSVCGPPHHARRGFRSGAPRASKKAAHTRHARACARASIDRRRIMAQLRFATSSHAASELHFLRCLYDTQRFRALTCATLRVGKPE